jgi:hypothetical protein
LSTIAERVEAEATAAEAEFPEPEPDTEPPPDTHEEEEAEHVSTTAPHGPTPEDVERGLAKIARSFATYQASVEKNHPSADETLARCPLCPDVHPGFIDTNDAGRIPDEVKQVVQLFLGIAQPVGLQPSPDTRTCGTCSGEGKVLSGSHVPQHRERTCPTCLGYGYEPPPIAQTQGAYVPPVEVSDFAPAGPAPVPKDADEWGEPRLLPDGRENPNYGRMPAHKISVLPWGVTAGLTALDG